MGHAPLRLIVKRTWHDLHTFTDTLECGHESWQITDFVWEPGLKHLPPTAKRRRCRDCQAAEKLVKKPTQTLYDDCRASIPFPGKKAA